MEKSVLLLSMQIARDTAWGSIAFLGLCTPMPVVTELITVVAIRTLRQGPWKDTVRPLGDALSIYCFWKLAEALYDGSPVRSGYFAVGSALGYLWFDKARPYLN